MAENAKAMGRALFEKEIKATLETDEARGFYDALVETIPEYFWEVGASSTGKYHPEYALGENGLARHTCALVRFLNHTFAIECMHKYSARQRDMLRLAGMMHDSRKSGDQAAYEENPYTKHEHPLLAAEVVRGFKGRYLEPDEVEAMAQAIESHMGQWTTNKYSNVVLPKPESGFQRILHWADYLASRKDIEVKF